MPTTVSADFDTRRDAEMAVEHIVQEHGVDRAAVTVLPVSEDNSAGTRLSGSDVDKDAGQADTEPALAGRLRVTVEVGNGPVDKVLASFATYGGQRAD